MTALIVFVSEIAKPELSAARLAKRSSNSGPSYNRGNYISCRILRISTDFSDFQIFRPGSGRRLGFALRGRRAQAILAARGQADAAPLDRAPARHAGSGDRLRGARFGGHGVSQARLERLRQPARHALLRRRALREAEHVTDEASAVEALGYKPKLVEGSTKNIKVTFPADLEIAEKMLKGVS